MRSIYWYSRPIEVLLPVHDTSSWHSIPAPHLRKDLTKPPISPVLTKVLTTRFNSEIWLIHIVIFVSVRIVFCTCMYFTGLTEIVIEILLLRLLVVHQQLNCDVMVRNYSSSSEYWTCKNWLIQALNRSWNVVIIGGGRQALVDDGDWVIILLLWDCMLTKWFGITINVICNLVTPLYCFILLPVFNFMFLISANKRFHSFIHSFIHSK